MSPICHDGQLSLPAHRHARSLVERKKQQWAREREELAGLEETAPWGTRDSVQCYDGPNIKTRHVAQYEKGTEYVRRDSSYSTCSGATAADTPRRGQRSLPPLHTNQHVTQSPDEQPDKEMGGETSGYGSDNARHTPEHMQRAGGDLRRPDPRTLAAARHAASRAPNNGYESSSSGQGDRLRWGGRRWRAPQDAPDVAPGAPGWVKRGLERDTEAAVVVSNSSPAESPEQDFAERPRTSSTIATNRCFLRGQNVPIDSAELAARERRRHVALAHQEAVREQLEERERRRQEERARRLREEYEEERRIAREREVERRREEAHERQRMERAERERRRKDALREAIEIAEKEAKDEKLKQRLMRQNQLNIYSDDGGAGGETEKMRKNQDNERLAATEKQDGGHDGDEEQANNAKKARDETNAKARDEHDRQLVVLNSGKNASSDSDASAPSIAENLTALLQNPPAESMQMQNVQFVLIPFSTSAAQTHVAASTTRTENRLLTPTQYRNRKTTCDSWTQTDFPDCRSRKERRSRSEMPHGELLEARERPKWGVNRPPTRYLTQSEKDPLYQRRKMRQKLRQTKTYDDRRYSSDDSQTGSPRTCRKKRAFWRKVYQTEIVPVESDKDHVYFRGSHQCCCRCVRSDARTATKDASSQRTVEREKLPACNNGGAGIRAGQLTSIHNDLMLKDDWDEPSVLCSPSRNC